MRRRRAIIVFISGVITMLLLAGAMPRLVEESLPPSAVNLARNDQTTTKNTPALEALNDLPVKGRAAKTGYSRAAFGDGWATIQGCSTRNIILNRDLTDVVIDHDCKVLSGTLNDPYTGETIIFSSERSTEVQIDHVVALSDAWQKGAQQLSPDMREQLANDPLELLAVSGVENQAKGDGDAATWVPKHKPFHCEYVARQIAVKKKYALWVTMAEKSAMANILQGCPNQIIPGAP